MPSDDLTLYDIHAGIAETSAALEETTDPAEVARLQETLRAYVREEVRKVGRIRGAIKHWEMLAREAREQAKTYSGRATALESRVTRLKALVQETMGEIGASRIEAPAGTFRVQGNGGVRPLVIAQPDLVPESLRTSVMKLTKVELRYLVKLTDEAMGVSQARETADCIGGKLARAANEARPDEAYIREALKTESVPGCYLDERGEHLRVE
jgi:hypothetical protein